jgi:uncharacterized protein
VYVGSLRVDLLLGDVHSLKAKRALVRPVLAELRRRHDVAAAETGAQDLHRRAEIGVAVVSSTPAHCSEVLRACERLVADRPEYDLLSAQTRVWSTDDE